MKSTNIALLLAAASLAFSSTSLSAIAGTSATKAAEIQALENAKAQERAAALVQAQKQAELNAIAAQEAAAKAGKGNALYQEELQKQMLQQQALKEKVLTEERAAQINAAEGAAIRNAEQAKQAQNAAEWAARHQR